MIQLNWYKIFGVQIPDGSTVLPTDDIQIWLHCANIWVKAYTTLAEVLADSTTLSALISDNNATDYLVRSTTWASGMCADSTAMTYIGLNNYCANKLLADATWRTAICNSTYFESVLNVKVPTMTSNTTPSGVASSSSVYTSGYEAYKAFDNDNSTSTAFKNTDTSRYVQYDFGRAVRIFCVGLKPRQISAGITVKDFKVKVSSDNITFTEVYSGTHGNNNNLEKYSITINNDYRSYRLSVDNSYASPSFYNIETLQFYGREDV